MIDSSSLVVPFEVFIAVILGSIINFLFIVLLRYLVKNNKI